MNILVNSTHAMQPVAGDWRSKVKAARKASKAEASESSPSSANDAEPAVDTLKKEKSSQSSKKGAAANGKASKPSKPDLEALARGLPAGWRPMYDKASSSVYYGNLSTKVGTLVWPWSSMKMPLLAFLACR